MRKLPGHPFNFTPRVTLLQLLMPKSSEKSLGHSRQNNHLKEMKREQKGSTERLNYMSRYRFALKSIYLIF
jgi:hypothetical protein